MKKILLTIAIILAVVIGGIFFINVQKQETDVTKKQTKVGVLLNGTRDDKTYSQSHYEGLEKTAESLNLNIIYKENVPQTKECMTIIEDLIKDGCEIIICNSFGFGEWALKVAKEYPEIYFFHATGTENSDNLATYFGRIYQMRYLTGIVAGLQTESNQIGYVAAFPISEVNRGINAFTLGVKAVNPDACVYVHWSNSWTDDTSNGTTTRNLLEERPEVDVIAMHTDSLEPLRIAEEKGIWSIGYNMDNSKEFPKTYLTAPIWQWDKFYEPKILSCLQGKFQGKHYWEGVETGIASLAELTDNVKPGIRQYVLEEKAKLESGKMDVFFGPICDQDGNIKVPEGESMTDETMLNLFDWYVEGVIVEHEE